MKAYHYTVSDRIASIRKHGIKLAGAGVLGLEKHAVWFSTNPVYETTACKAGTSSLQGMIDFGFTPVRFVVDREMFDWKYHKAHSGIKSAIARGLEEAGKQTNANPSEWFAVYEPVKEWLAIEVYRNGQWVELEEDEIENLAKQKTPFPLPIDEDEGFTISMSVGEFLSQMRRAG
ncbi:MAG: hypothetical protein CVV47_13470 [Spirochaetae bacterium HGW-Spirochaetae-3]|jgi:hypothetical protein|nr:MAG: hypothetical protein CVV47_13470 [Spirochaetae bacterium HGW-Spirochaetae-3]